jgi:hypothetical protein
MSKKSESFVGGQRAGKTKNEAGTVDAIKNYIRGISKKDRDAIRRELETEGSDEEPPSPEFPGVKIATNVYPSFTTKYYTFTPSEAQQKFAWTNMTSWDSFAGWDANSQVVISNEPLQKQEIIEDVQDVSFED